jgi:hypothetical protein
VEKPFDRLLGCGLAKAFASQRDTGPKEVYDDVMLRCSTPVPALNRSAKRCGFRIIRNPNRNPHLAPQA